MSLDRQMMGAIAATRLGLGARPGEIAAASDDPKAFLLEQIRPSGADIADAAMPTSAQRLEDLRRLREERQARKQSMATQASPAAATRFLADSYRPMSPTAGAVQPGDANADPVKMAARTIRDDAGGDFLARLQLAATTPASFRERWALFWANHFTVSAVKIDTAPLVGPFEQEAIRPRVFGPFIDLLVASSSHPAMLLYLDQAQSIGPDSLAGLRQGEQGQRRGLNENLAREIMELHTVGVDAGYTQADVTEFARAMTGWSLARAPEAAGAPDGFLFRPRAHEPGSRLVMGRRYGEGDQDQALRVMRDLAASPHTARHLATKLARHFVADDPPPSLVDRLAGAYQESDGDLAHVARALIDAPETWAAAPAKFKTPYEFIVSAWRATGGAPQDPRDAAPILNAMGQKPFSAPSPKGWPDEAGAWAAPDAVIKRMTWSEAFSARTIGERDPLDLAHAALGARLSPLAAQTIARAETRAEGLSVLLMSPEFQRR